ncbi:MAG: HAD hydrolase-like protein [Arenimonas sp.]|nr:HAD hydrolase-like protein [Arenimonas sp.]MBP6626674.1 HAD hydrolase-like protein [Arenimonas sp.]
MAAIFLDLDGTLIDSALGITRCVAHAFEQLGEPVPPLDQLRRWIGPPLRDSFGPLLGDAARTELAVAHYRERFETHGWAEHVVYAGIGEAVLALSAAGHRLAVVTAKNEPHARKIIAHLPFGGVFEDIIGATPCGRLSHKPELIAEALSRLSLSPGDSWMVGDRHMDIDGANHHGMRSVGVLWGFGGADELRAAGATRLVSCPTELAGAFAA